MLITDPRTGVLIALLAVAAVVDWRTRRIPNWLTVPGLVAGVAVNAVAAGWPGAKSSLLGAGLGLLVLLPFVVIKALGAASANGAGLDDLVARRRGGEHRDVRLRPRGGLRM